MAEDAKRSVGAPSLDGALGSLTWQGGASPQHRLELDELRGPFQPQPFRESVIPVSPQLCSGCAVCFPTWIGREGHLIHAFMCVITYEVDGPMLVLAKRNKQSDHCHSCGRALMDRHTYTVAISLVVCPEERNPLCMKAGNTKGALVCRID